MTELLFQASSRWDATRCNALLRVRQGNGSPRGVQLQNASLSGSCTPLADEQREAGMSDELTDEQPIRQGSRASSLADQRVALLARGMQRLPAGGWPYRGLAITRMRVTRGTGQSRHRPPESAAFARSFRGVGARPTLGSCGNLGAAAGPDLAVPKSFNERLMPRCKRGSPGIRIVSPNSMILTTFGDAQLCPAGAESDSAVGRRFDSCRSANNSMTYGALLGALERIV